MLHTRRTFLRTGALGGAITTTLPAFLAGSIDQLEAAADGALVAAGNQLPILVVLQLAGGNDGLNAVVPFTNDHYHKARPRLGLKADQVLKLNDSVGLHPALAGFQRLHDQGHLGIIQGVGYPNPNRSHFRSTEIWHTASDANRAERHGWIGRYFDHACAGADPTVGVALGRQVPQVFAAARPTGITLSAGAATRGSGTMDGQSEEPMVPKMAPGSQDSEDNSVSAGGSIGSVAGSSPTAGSPVDFLERTALDAQVSDRLVRAATDRGRNMGTYPASGLATQLKSIARWISGGLPTRIYYLSQGGFDTHTQQLPAQERLLRELGDAMAAFVGDLKVQGLLDRTLILTFSEFGRRVSENASGGTDHGAAAPVFLSGGRIRPGIHGNTPDLAPTALLNGDIRHSVDFRGIYAGILEQWMKTPSKPILGREFRQHPIFT